MMVVSGVGVCCWILWVCCGVGFCGLFCFVGLGRHSRLCMRVCVWLRVVGWFVIRDDVGVTCCFWVIFVRIERCLWLI